MYYSTILFAFWL